MKFAICNEVFGQSSFVDAFSTIAKLGYKGVEIAPFTLASWMQPFDIRQIAAERILNVRQAAEDAGVEIVGLHWLLANTDGFYLTSPDPNVRRHTAEYLRSLAEVCASLGGKVMVLGSPKQRNLLPGVSHEDAMEYAAEVLNGAIPACTQLDITIAVEPLGPTEGDFLLTAQSAIRLVEMVGSTHCRLHLDVKAMSSEQIPIDEIIRQSAPWIAHFHANDPNLLGPGMGAVDYGPIFAALNAIHYQGWVSVEPFKYQPSPVEVARRSIEYLNSFVVPG